MGATVGEHHIPSQVVEPCQLRSNTYDKNKKIIEAACVQPNCQVTSCVSGVKYLVSFDGNALGVKHFSLIRRLLANFFGWGRCGQEALQRSLAVDFVQYKSELITVKQKGDKEFHHKNVMSIEVLTKHVIKPNSLVLLDVDYTLTKAKNNHNPYAAEAEAVEAQDLLRKVIEEIKQKTPGVRFALLTNATGTEVKLRNAGIHLPNEVEILEIQNQTQYEAEKKAQCGAQDETLTYDEYYVKSLDKGKRLKTYLGNLPAGVRIDCVHFIDDSPSCLNSVATAASELNLECHAYDFILTAGLKHHPSLKNKVSQRRIIAKNLLQLKT